MPVSKPKSGSVAVDSAEPTLAGKLATIRELHALGALRVTFPGVLEVVFAPPQPTVPDEPQREQTPDEHDREWLDRATQSARS